MSYKLSPVEIAQEADYGFFDSAAFTAEAMSSPQKLAKVIDHSFLKPESTREQLVKHCEQAFQYPFACVMVYPVWASTAVKLLSGSGVPAACVIGFPFGIQLDSTLRQETAALMRLGIREVDMVLPVGQLKSGNFTAVHRTIHTAAHVARQNGAILKVILENCLLTMEEKLRASQIAIEAGADFLKTSTGFSTGGATVADIALMRGVAGDSCGVKASGGVRTLADCRAMLEAGASRIGASASVNIVQELEAALRA